MAIIPRGDRLKDEGQQAEDVGQKIRKDLGPGSNTRNHSPLEFFLFFKNIFLEVQYTCRENTNRKYASQQTKSHKLYTPKKAEPGSRNDMIGTPVSSHVRVFFQSSPSQGEPPSCF